MLTLAKSETHCSQSALDPQRALALGLTRCLTLHHSESPFGFVRTHSQDLCNECDWVPAAETMWRSCTAWEMFDGCLGAKPPCRLHFIRRSAWIKYLGVVIEGHQGCVGHGGGTPGSESSVILIANHLNCLNCQGSCSWHFFAGVTLDWESVFLRFSKKEWCARRGNYEIEETVLGLKSSSCDITPLLIVPATHLNVVEEILKTHVLKRANRANTTSAMTMSSTGLWFDVCLRWRRR